ncbi:helix-turn-helix domain-containing protein [Streptomyces sp. NBC_01187]|uniref:helix-turn-helix domain-containing protein n=1 Tax=Streptomyces sp. NBC_01187 TaxID=2903766 RepID=UPI0038699CED|nr:helix-turn-helix domain-containing protein [Streptomyces sp. NBC_01187]
MTAGRGGSELAELLEELKQRSGRSYAALAHRTGLGRSTVHRYCLGTTVPRTFGVVEKVARVCGADRAELDRLYRAWCQAIDAEDGAEDDAANDAEDGAAIDAANGADDAVDGAEAPSVPASPPASPASRAPSGAAMPLRGLQHHHRSLGAGGSAARLRAYFWLRVAALVLVLAIPSGAVSASYPEAESGGRRVGSPARSGGADRQDVKGPDWTVAPQRVPDAFYGMNLGSDTGEMPGFRVGSVRLWHSGTRWSQLEPRRGKYRWQTLDRLVDAAERKGLPVLLTLGGTPPWAAPDGRRSVFADARASPPDKMADWDRFIGALAARYRGRIEAYELWDYPSHQGVWTGSTATLADMVQRASRIIREADPEAKAVCPSFGSLWEKRGRDLLRKFARTGTFQYCDAAALKLPPRRADGPPEERVTLVKRVQRLLYSEGLGRTPLWDTGPDSDVALREHLDARRARDHAVRFYLVGLYLKDQSLSRTYFYSWGSSEVPLVVELAGGPPTEAGRRIERLQRWLEGARITSCGSGTEMGLPPHAYTCRFERDGRPLRVYWTERGKAQVRLDADARVLRHMDGTESPAPSGRRLRIGEEPVLVEHRRTGG